MASLCWKKKRSGEKREKKITNRSSSSVVCRGGMASGASAEFRGCFFSGRKKAERTHKDSVSVSKVGSDAGSTSASDSKHTNTSHFHIKSSLIPKYLQYIIDTVQKYNN